MKDPAIVFYTSDFMVGVSNLTMEERGQYITLLCLEHQLGRLSKKIIELNVKDVSQDVLNKFEIDNEGNYYNKRLEHEIEKRSKFIKHQQENGLKGGRPKKPKQNPNETQTITQIKPKHKPKKKPLENENEIENIIINIINYINNKLNSKYKYNSNNTRTKINARLNEGYTYEDFIKVIDKKYNEWVGTEFEKYLCPDTLFGTKFEKYLNQKEVKTEEHKTAQEKRFEMYRRLEEEYDNQGNK